MRLASMRAWGRIREITELAAMAEKEVLEEREKSETDRRQTGSPPYGEPSQ